MQREKQQKVGIGGNTKIIIIIKATTEEKFFNGKRNQFVHTFTCYFSMYTCTATHSHRIYHTWRICIPGRRGSEKVEKKRVLLYSMLKYDIHFFFVHPFQMECHRESCWVCVVCDDRKITYRVYGFSNFVVMRECMFTPVYYFVSFVKYLSLSHAYRHHQCVCASYVWLNSFIWICGRISIESNSSN